MTLPTYDTYATIVPLPHLEGVAIQGTHIYMHITVIRKEMGMFWGALDRKIVCSIK